MRSLYLVAGTTMAGVSSVFALLAEIHNEYGIAERDLRLDRRIGLHRRTRYSAMAF